jgi:Leucine-rich repeat (LRR) protein
VHDNILERVSSRLGTLLQLKALNLAQNRLAHFPTAILELRQLQSLKLNTNAITELPADLGRLLELRELVVLLGLLQWNLPVSVSRIGTWNESVVGLAFNRMSRKIS